MILNTFRALPLLTTHCQYRDTASQGKNTLQGEKEGSPASKASSNLDKSLPNPPQDRLKSIETAGNSLLPRDILKSNSFEEPQETQEVRAAFSQPERYPKLPSGSYSVPVREDLRQTSKNSARKYKSNNIPLDASSSKKTGDPDSQQIRAPKVEKEKRSLSHPQALNGHKMQVDEPRQMRSSSLCAESLTIPPSDRSGQQVHPASVVTDWAYKQSIKKTIRGNLPAPATFVGGRRRPASKRPESRNSNTGSAEDVHTLSSGPAPSSTGSMTSAKSEAAARRRSSIPVLRGHASQNIMRDGKTTSSSTESTINVFEDAVSTLEPIQGSPAHEYHTKRLSVNSPTYGPVLRISRSAEDVIMGTGSDKENDPPSNTVTDAETRSAPTRNVRPSRAASLAMPLNVEDTKNEAANWNKKTRIIALETEKIREASTVYPAQIVKSDPLDDPFVDQPSKTHDGGPASETLVDPFKSPEDEYDVNGFGMSTLMTDTAEKAAVESAKQEWISPVTRMARRVSMDLVKPVLEDYSPPVPPKDIPRSNVPTEANMGIPSETTQASFVAQSNLTGKTNLSTPPSASRLPIATHTKSTQPPIEPAGSNEFPPRSSSRMVHPAFGGLDPRRPELSSPTQVTRNLSNGNAQSSNAYHGDPTKLQSQPSLRPRESTALESTKSHASLSKSGVLSNIRGLFLKRSATQTADSTKTPRPNNKKGKKGQSIKTSNKAPQPTSSNVHPAYRPTASSTSRTRSPSPYPRLTPTTTTTTIFPPYNSPPSAPRTNISSSTTLAMQILESARKERSSPKKERLLELGKIMVDAITQARDAERAMEEAKQAARKAEVAHGRCVGSVGEVARCVVGLRNEFVVGRVE